MNSIVFLVGHMQLEVELQLPVPTCYILDTSGRNESKFSTRKYKQESPPAGKARGVPHAAWPVTCPSATQSRTGGAPIESQWVPHPVPDWEGTPSGKGPGTSGTIMGWRWGTLREGYLTSGWKYYRMEIGYPSPTTSSDGQVKTLSFVIFRMRAVNMGQQENFLVLRAPPLWHMDYKSNQMECKAEFFNLNLRLR